MSHVPESDSLQKQKAWGQRLALGSSQHWPLLGSIRMFTVAWFQLMGRVTALFLDKWSSLISLLGSCYPGCFIWEENGYIMMGEKQRRGWGSADLALFSILNRIAM